MRPAAAVGGIRAPALGFRRAAVVPGPTEVRMRFGDFEAGRTAFALAFVLPPGRDLYDLPIAEWWAYGLAAAVAVASSPLLGLGARLTERWFRSDDARTRRPDGQGLGLAIAAESIKRLGWALAFERPAEGGLRAVIRSGRTESRT